MSLRSSFTDEMIGLIAARRRETVASPVLDRWRYPDARAEELDPAQEQQIVQFLRDNAERFDRAAGLLADDDSRELLKLLFAYRALGPRHVALPTAAAHERKLAAAQARDVGPSELLFPPFEFRRFEIPDGEGSIRLECWLGNVYLIFCERQYFFRRGGLTIAPAPGDVVLDAGACFGDTALAFASTVGASGKVFAFEPMPRQREVILRNLERNPALRDRVSVHPFAIAREAGRTLTFSDSGAGARPSESGTVPVTTTTIDAFVKKESVPRVDFIKMDIEGSELGALEGARETIRRWQPRLAISAYHRWEDLLEIPVLLRGLVPSYRLYLDHHTVHLEETVLYATAGGATAAPQP